jgi:hypothetical protein
MDEARGSGLWYWLGRTLTVPDVRNCVECGSAHAVIFQHAAATEHESIIFSHRIGDNAQTLPTRVHPRCAPGHSYLPFYKVEIVGLRPEPCSSTASTNGTLRHEKAISGSAGGSVCPNLPDVLSNLHPTHPPEGTECMWSAWNRSRLRWGWPEDSEGAVCPSCTHQRVEKIDQGYRYHIGCRWQS